MSLRVAFDGITKDFGPVRVLHGVSFEIAQAIRARRKGGAKADRAVQFPGLADGVAGVEFIAAAVASARRSGRWVRLPQVGQSPPLKP